MQGTHSNYFFVFSVIDMKVAEVAETATSFLPSQGTCLYSNLFTCKYNTRRDSSPWLYLYLFLLPGWY